MVGGIQRSLQFNSRPNLWVLPEHLVGFSCETRVVYINIAGSNCISQPEVEPRIDPYHAGAKIELSSWLLGHFLLNDPCPPIFPELTCTQGSDNHMTKLLHRNLEILATGTGLLSEPLPAKPLSNAVSNTHGARNAI